LFKQQAEARKQADRLVEVPQQKGQEASKDYAATESSTEPSKLLIVPATGRRRKDRFEVPDILPAEFLTDSSSEDESGEDQTLAPRRKKRKVGAVERTFSKETRVPRDERVGTTVYRVLKNEDSSLAPRMRKHSRSLKEKLLVRGRSAQKRKGFVSRI